MISLEKDLEVYINTGIKSELMIETCKQTNKKNNRLLIQEDNFDEKIIIELINKLKLQTISIGREDFNLAKQLFDILSIPYHQATTVFQNASPAYYRDWFPL